MMSQKSKIYCFTKYSEKGPSSRYRTYQYIPFWEPFYDIQLHCLLDDWYFDKGLNIFKKGIKILKSFIARRNILKKIGKKDLIWIEYEIFPYLGPFAEKALRKKGIRFFLDYDDAIFHWYGNHRVYFIRKLLHKKIDIIMQMASCVVTGSPYLTNYAKKHNEHVIEIPTSVDMDLYETKGDMYENKPENCLVIGWLGSKTTSVNLFLIKEAFASFIKNVRSELWLMGYDEDLQAHWDGLPVRFYPWSEEGEKKFLRSIDVGIMPLYVSDFNQGKCGFKLIQYMAMGKPTISTPFAANKKIDRAGINFFAETKEDWLNCFKMVHEQISKIDFTVNREIIEKFYNTKVNEETYRDVFRKYLTTKIIE